MTVPDVVVVGVAVVVVVTVLILVLTVVVAATMDLVVVGGVEVALPLHISPAYAPAAGVLPASGVQFNRHFEFWAQNWVRNWAIFWDNFSIGALEVKTSLKTPNMGQVLVLILGRRKMSIEFHP